MPYPARYTALDMPLHLVQRGHCRGAVFFSDDDRRFYLASLHSAAHRYGLRIYAYVLMTNHVHLLVQPRATGAIQRTLQSVGRRYVPFINQRQGRSGTLWESRHHASPVRTERYLAACHAYIELNPVRAGMTTDPSDYPWSSCRHYSGMHTDPLITDAPTFVRSGISIVERRKVHWSLLAAGVEAAHLARIRDASRVGGALEDDPDPEMTLR